MKSLYFLFIIIFISLISLNNVIAQTISQGKRQAAIDSLQSVRLDAKLWAIQFIQTYNIVEARPIIENTIWQQKNVTLKLKFIEALQQFGSLYFQSYAHLIIDSSGIYSQDGAFFDSLQIKVKVTKILFASEDYSTSHFVFELFRSDTTKVDGVMVKLLNEIVLHVPQYADSAKILLKRIAKGNYGVSPNAYKAYVELFGEEVMDDIVEAFLNGETPDKRWFAMRDLCRLNYTGLHNLLVERLNTEPDDFLRLMIADSLLMRFGATSDYNIVIDHLSSESDTKIRSQLFFDIYFFKPSRFIGFNPISNQIDSLISIKHQVAGYGWLGNQDFIDELDNDLDSAKIYIQQGDSVNWRRLIKTFQNKVDEEYRDSLDGDTREVKLGGWQFLYWNAEYILAALSPGPGQHIVVDNSFLSNGISQNGQENDSLNQQEKNDLIASLDSLDFDTRLRAITLITDNNVAEAVPAIEKKIWLQEEQIIQELFLIGLWKLHSSNTYSFTKAFYDSASNFSPVPTPYELDPINAKITATEILFEFNDYSTANIVFQKIEKDTSQIDLKVIKLLEKIIENVPECELEAKEKLIEATTSNWFSFNRYYALKYLSDHYGAEILNIIYQCGINDSEAINRMAAIEYLSHLHYSDFENFLKSRLYNEPVEAYRIFIADSLLFKYHRLDLFKYVLDYSNQQSSTFVKDGIRLSLEGYFPSSPDSGTPIPIILDSLISIKHQVTGYGWLGSQDFIDELDNDLDSAKIYIQQGDSVNCRRLIKIFQNKIDEEYRDSLDGDTREVKLGGWQFLYWNAEYILAALPE